MHNDMETTIIPFKAKFFSLVIPSDAASDISNQVTMGNKNNFVTKKASGSNGLYSSTFILKVFKYIDYYNFIIYPSI